MLKIYFGNMEESIYNTSVRFDNTYENSWFQSSMVHEIIKDIDNSEVISPECIKSEVFGLIPPTNLSGGSKTLLLIMNEPDEIFNASTCGDESAKWILKIAKDRDVTINLRHIMNFGKQSFEIEVLNNNEIVHGMKELLPLASKFLRQEDD